MSDVPVKQRGSLPNYPIIKGENQATFFSPSKNWFLPAPSTPKPEEREFVVDSGASMHMLSKKDVNSAELETVTTPKSSTTGTTADGEVQTHEEATIYVKEMDIFLTMNVLEDTPAVLSVGKLCDEHGYSYQWITGQKPHPMENGVFGYIAKRRTSFRSWFLFFLTQRDEGCQCSDSADGTNMLKPKRYRVRWQSKKVETGQAGWLHDTSVHIHADVYNLIPDASWKFSVMCSNSLETWPCLCSHNRRVATSSGTTYSVAREESAKRKQHRRCRHCISWCREETSRIHWENWLEQLIMQQQTFGANDVQSGKTPFHTKCLHSGEETTKVMKSDDVPQEVRRSYFLYPWSMRACSITSCPAEAGLSIRLRNGSQSSPTYGSRSCHLVHCPPRVWTRSANSHTVHSWLFVSSISPLFGWIILYLFFDLFRKTIFLCQTLMLGDTLVKAPYPGLQQNSRATFEAAKCRSSLPRSAA